MNISNTSTSKYQLSRFLVIIMRAFFLFYLVLFAVNYSFFSVAGVDSDEDEDEDELVYAPEYNKEEHFPPKPIQYFLENYEYININEKKEKKEKVVDSILSAFHGSCFLIAGIKEGIINYAYHIPPQKLTDEEKFDHLFKDFDHKTQKENGLQQIIFYYSPEDLNGLKKKFEVKGLNFRPDREVSFEKYIDPMSVLFLRCNGDNIDIYINSKKNIYDIYKGCGNRIFTRHGPIESGPIFEK
jgi:hypothetical protein